MAADVASIFALNATAQTLNTAPAKVTKLITAGQFDNKADASVVPDAANNRILCAVPSSQSVVAPPVGSPSQPTAPKKWVKVHFTVSAECPTAGVVIFTLRKGAAVITDGQCRMQFPGAASNVQASSFVCTIPITDQDANQVPATAVSLTVGGTPYFSALEIYGESDQAGGIAVTIKNACLLVEALTLD